MGGFDVVEPQAAAAWTGRGFSAECLPYPFQISCDYCFPFCFNSAFLFLLGFTVPWTSGVFEVCPSPWILLRFNSVFIDKFSRVFSWKGKEHKEVQSGHSEACGEVFALGRDFIICNGFRWTPEDVMSSQVLVSGVRWSLFQGKGTPWCWCWGCVRAGMHAATKGCFPFLFHYFTDAEGCTGDARSGYVLKSLHWHLVSQLQWCFKSRVHIASESVSDPGLAVRNQNPAPNLHIAFSFHFLMGKMLLFPESSLSHPFTFLSLSPGILLLWQWGVKTSFGLPPLLFFQCYLSALWRAEVLVQGVKCLSAQECVSLLLCHPLPK